MAQVHIDCHGFNRFTSLDSGMLYPLFRLLKPTLVVLLLLVAMTYVGTVNAQTCHQYESQAYAAAEADATAEASAFMSGRTNPPWSTSTQTIYATSSKSGCSLGGVHGQYRAFYNGDPATSFWINAGFHAWAEEDPSCTAGEIGFLITGAQEPTSWCDDNCEWEATTGVCDDYQCYYNAETTGETCESPPPPGGDIPEGCSLDAFGFLVCDCTSNPSDPQCLDPDTPDPDLPPNCIRSGDLIYCSDTDPPVTGPDPDYGDPDVPPQNPPPNTPPVGDGDPSTPCTGDQCGDGDTDEDGDRDVDCNPQSNPDCQYTSNALGSGSCDAAPVCSGDPVGCAILYQEWASMCYGNGSASNTVNCDDITIDCEGDLMFCEILYQQKKFHCDLFHGSSSFDNNVFDDSDFSNSPKNSAEVVDVVTDFDQAGFASGSCPADIPVDTAFGSYNVSFQMFCDLADIIRAMVILSALIGGALIVSGSRT